MAGSSAADWPTQTIAESFLQIKADYRAARETRFTPRLRGTAAAGSGADYHYVNEWHYLHIIERARDYERNDPVFGQGLRRLVTNCIQEGFSPDPKTGDKDLDAVLKEKWEEFATTPDLCHSEGELCFHQMERLALSSTIRDGDHWALLTEEGTVQLIEGHRPRTPSRTQRNVILGVMLDDHARRQEVWISKEDLASWNVVSRVSDVERYPIRDEFGNRQVLQVYFPNRTSQRRGMSAIAPISDMIGMHDDLQFATLVKQQLSALVVFLREQAAGNTPGTPGPPIGNLASTAATVQTRTGSIKQIPGIQAGLDVTGEPGEKIQGFTPNIPGTSFFEHTALLLTFVAINLDLPLQVLLLEPKANFSAWRGAIDQARTRFREIQKDFSNQFHRPIYEWKVRQWMSQSSALRGMAERTGVRYLRHSWKRPSFAYIEPLKDAQADAMQSDKFLNSFRRLQAARGRDWDEIAAEIVDDRVDLIERAIVAAIGLQQRYAKYDIDVTWRDILSADLGALPRTPAPVETPDDEESSSSKVAPAAPARGTVKE